MAERKHFAVLDGLRGVASLAIVFIHTSLWNDAPYAPPHAGLAVDFFFCLSGFVIAHAYDPAFAQGRLDLTGFAQRRIARLYPMILFGLVFGALMASLTALHGGDRPLWLVGVLTLSGAFMIPIGTVFGLQTFPINPPMWSLFFEGVANAVYGVVGARRFPPLVAALGVALAAGAVIAGAVLAHGVDGYGFNGTLWLPGGLARVAYPFIAGVIIARLGWWRGPARAPLAAIVAVLALMLFWPLTPRSWPYDIVAVLLVLPTIVALGARLEPGPAMTRVCKTLGDVSYPLYAMHLPLILAMQKIDRNLLHLGSAEGLTVLTVLIAPPIAWVVLKIYDEPVRAWLARGAKSRTAVSVKAPLRQPS